VDPFLGREASLIESADLEAGFLLSFEIRVGLLLDAFVCGDDKRNTPSWPPVLIVAVLSDETVGI
jgi:hypothetical protein